jgi:hypothetical protein
MANPQPAGPGAGIAFGILMIPVIFCIVPMIGNWLMGWN